MTRYTPLYGGRRHKKVGSLWEREAKKVSHAKTPRFTLACEFVVDVLNGDVRQELERPFLSTLKSLEFWASSVGHSVFFERSVFPSRHLC